MHESVVHGGGGGGGLFCQKKKEKERKNKKTRITFCAPKHYIPARSMFVV